MVMLCTMRAKRTCVRQNTLDGLYWIGEATRCCQNIGADRYIQSTGLLQCTAAWRVGRADASSTISPERRGSTSDRRAAPRPHHADLTTAPLAAHTSTGRFQDHRPGLSVSDRPGTRVSGRRLSAYFRRQYAPTPTDTATCVVRRSGLIVDDASALPTRQTAVHCNNPVDWI